MKIFIQMETEDDMMIKELVYDVVDNITEHYDFINYMNTDNKKSKTAEAIKNYCDNKLKNKEINLISNCIRVVELKSEVVPKKQEYYHLAVHKQFVPNLCGYHATYNLIQAIQSLKYQIPPQFENIAGFWIYVKRTQEFLKYYRDQCNLDNTAWPWQDKDIDSGDFERTYLKVCCLYKPLFKTSFQSEIINGIKYQVSFNSIFFQYGNIVNAYNERRELQKNFDKFIQFIPNAHEILIQAYMLGVTNHWIAFLAIKSVKGIQFMVMDSRNRDYFKWNQQQMKEFLDKENIERQKRGQEQWNKFYLDLYLQGMVDIQQLNELLVSWLTGQGRIETYVTNQKVKVFLEPLLQLLELNQDQFLQMNNLGPKTYEMYQVFSIWTEQYKHTIQEFLGSPIDQLDINNKKLFLKTLELLKQAQKYEKDNNLWIQSRKSSPITQVIKQFVVLQCNL